MSSEALAWAFAQDVRPSALKFTLVALCECANFKSGLIYPSNAHIVSMTGQDRKTVIANIAKLELLGLIVDHGDRTGKTKQVKVYKIGTKNSAKNSGESVPETGQLDGAKSPKKGSPKTGPFNSPKNGTLTDLKSPVFPIKESQKRDTEPSMEPSIQLANANCISARENFTSESDPEKQVKPKRKPSLHPVPENWTPEPFGQSTTCRAIVDGWPPGEVDQQVERFVANHQARGTTYANWQAAWKTWVINSNKFGQNHGTANRQYPASIDRRDNFTKAIDEALDVIRNPSVASKFDGSAVSDIAGHGGRATPRLTAVRC